MSINVSKGKNNILMTIILLIFIGQASASSVISCSMMSQQMTLSDMHMMSDMQHSIDHSMAEMDGANTQTMTMMQDCCSGDSNCSMSGCVIIAVISEMAMQGSQFVQQNIKSDYSMAPRQSLSSLYRPPILS